MKIQVLFFSNYSLESYSLLFLGLNLNLFLFLISLLGILYNRRNLLLTFLCLELIFFSVSLNFIFFGFFSFIFLGYVYGLLVITIAAAETAIGLSLLVIFCRLSGKVSFDCLITLRG